MAAIRETFLAAASCPTALTAGFSRALPTALSVAVDSAWTSVASAHKPLTSSAKDLGHPR